LVGFVGKQRVQELGECYCVTVVISQVHVRDNNDSQTASHLITQTKVITLAASTDKGVCNNSEVLEKFEVPEVELDLFLWAVNDHAKLFRVRTPPEPTRSLLHRAYFMAQFP